MTKPLKSITECFHAKADCKTRLGTGTVCESHPALAWGDLVSDPSNPWLGACYCGAAGMPCPTCNPAIEGPPEEIGTGLYRMADGEVVGGERDYEIP